MLRTYSYTSARPLRDTTEVSELGRVLGRVRARRAYPNHCNAVSEYRRRHILPRKTVSRVGGRWSARRIVVRMGAAAVEDLDRSSLRVGDLLHVQ
jgi:hypothetical protein